MKLPYLSIFDAVIHRVSPDGILRYMRRTARRGKPLIIFPINIHILVELIKNPPILKKHNTADIVFADGVPLIWLSAIAGRQILQRVSGTCLTKKILKEFNKIFLIAPTPGILQKIIAKYNADTKKISGGYCPPEKVPWGDRVHKEIIDQINKTKSRIVLVGVGPLKQEQWILENAHKTHAVVFVAIGSALDILSGEKPRSPAWMQAAGLEWLWRILLEPKRLFPRYVRDGWFVLKLATLRCVRYIIKSNRMLFGLIVLNIILATVLLRQYPSETIGYRADEQRTGVYQSRLFAGIPQWWRFKTDGLLTCTPVIVDNKLYISSWENFTLYVLDASSGKLLWQYTADGDVPFTPTVFQNTVYVGSVDGHMYALDNTTGKLRWKFATEQRKSITTHPLIYNNTVLFGSRDGFMYALDWKTGKKIWSFQSEDINDNTALRVAWPGQKGKLIESSPLVDSGILYFGSFNGKIYGLNAQTGKLAWEYQTGGVVLSSPAISGNTLVVGSEDAYVYAFRLSDKKLLWKTQTSGSIDATPAIKSDSVIINTLNNTLYALSLSSGKILWKNTINTSNHSGAAIDGDTVYFGSSDNSLYAINLKNGKTKWVYTVNQPVEAAPSVVGNTIFFTSGWYVYTLNKYTGKPFIDVSRATIVNAPTRASLYEPVEFSLTHNDQIYQNPWNEASVSAVFVSPSNKTIPVDGFYYDHNEWRIRFAPNETGEWRWSIFVRPAPSSERVFSGRFTTETSESPGFIRIDKHNPYRFVFDNGKLFYPLGIGDALLDANGNGYPLDDFSVDEKPNVSLNQYAQEYGSRGAKFNTFRLSIDNASFKLWNSQYSLTSEKSARWDTYPTKNGLWADELVQTFRKNGLRIWMTIWGFNPNSSTENTDVIYRQTSIEAYLRYVVARYGAYVDVWELGNEAKASDFWISYVTHILTSIDPYHHPISMNWEKPDRPEINITSLHWYHTELLQETGVAMANEINQFKQWQKPIIFSEEGNKYANWDETSGVRMRVRIWTAFFNDASLIFWDTSGTKKFTSTKNANIYLGPDERRYVKVFQNTIDSLPADYWPMTLLLNNSGIRYFAVASDSRLLAYFFHYADPSQKISAQVSLYRERRGTAQFINPENGDVVSNGAIAAGWNTLTIPYFACDIVLKIQ
jgi:exopolysaccharide biosynthesis WecB/TagA/CpsF family protein